MTDNINIVNPVSSSQRENTEKVKSFDENIHLSKKYNIGITVGVFDLFHIGHLNLFERCKEQCNHLIVAICNDDYVKNIKNKTPIIPENERVRICNALKCVDEVILVNIQETEDKMLLLKNHKFDVLFSGDDWKGSERYIRTEKQFNSLGVSIEYLPYTKGISTSKIKSIIENQK